MDLIPLYGGGKVLFIVALVLFPNEGGKGSHNGQIRRETTGTSYPVKSSLCLQKGSGGGAMVGSAMTSVLPSWRSWSCCTDIETFA